MTEWLLCHMLAPETQNYLHLCLHCIVTKFVCVEVLWFSQTNGVMLSAVSLPNHTFTWQADLDPNCLTH